jgi:hypothetical protein
MGVLSEDSAADHREHALTIRQFCILENVAVATYYKMRRLGHGPDEMRIPGTALVRITQQARRDWHARIGELGRSAGPRSLSAGRHHHRQRADAVNEEKHWRNRRSIVCIRRGEITGTTTRGKQPDRSSEDDWTRVVASGTNQRIGFFYAVNPDCSASGDINIRV